jgi:hypothetical protein
VTAIPGLVSAVQIFIASRIYSPGEAGGKSEGGSSASPDHESGVIPVTEADEGKIISITIYEIRMVITG